MYYSRVPHDHCVCWYLRRKNFNDTELWKLWLAGGNRIINFQRWTNQKLHGWNIWKNTLPTFYICLFVSALIKENHTAHMYGGVKILKHNVGTTFWLVYPVCENLTHTSKKRHVKRTQLIEPLGSRLVCLLLFQTEKNRTQRNRHAKWCEFQIRTVARMSSIMGYYIGAGGLDILKIW